MIAYLPGSPLRSGGRKERRKMYAIKAFVWCLILRLRHVVHAPALENLQEIWFQSVALDLDAESIS